MMTKGNHFITEDEFCQGIVETFKVERKRWESLTPAQQADELARMTPEDRHYIEHGGPMPRRLGIV